MKTYAHLVRSLALSLIVIALAIFLTRYLNQTMPNQPIQHNNPSQQAAYQPNNLITLKNSFKEAVLNKQSPVIVTFFAEWCPGCNAMHPVVEEVAKEFKDIQFVDVNVDEFEDIANNYGIQAIPTFVFFNKGTAVDRTTGFMNKEQFTELIRKQFNLV